MAVHPNELHFRREQEKILADSRARAQQTANDWTASRQRYRDQNAAAEFADRIQRITTPPPRPRKESPLLISGHAATVFVPDESQQDVSSNEEARCFSASIADFLARILGYALTGAMWGYAAIVVMPWLYASAFNRTLVGLAVGLGLSVNLAVWIICGIEFLVLCRVAKSIATGTASCMAWFLVLPVVGLEAGFDAVFRKKSS
jgi:hypothetical protein